MGMHCHTKILYIMLWTNVRNCMWVIIHSLLKIQSSIYIKNDHIENSDIGMCIVISFFSDYKIPSLNAGKICFSKASTPTEYISSEIWEVSSQPPGPSQGQRTTLGLCYSSENQSIFRSYLIRVWGSGSMEGGPLLSREGFTNTPWPGGQRK